jgi:hypothetical protein
MGRTAAAENQQKIAGSTIISHYVKVSGVRQLCDLAHHAGNKPQKKPTNAEPTRSKINPNGLANEKLTPIFIRPERSLKQPANCGLKTANNPKKLKEAIRLWRKVL